MRGQKNHRCLQTTPNMTGGLNPVHVTLDDDIHQHQIGTMLLYQRERVLAAVGGCAHVVTHLPQLLFQIHRYNGLIFDDKYFWYADCYLLLHHSHQMTSERS